MENGNKKAGKKTPQKIEELKRKNKQHEETYDESETTHETELDDSMPKITRENDFTNTHSDRGRRKAFGVDHEPGTL